MDIPKRYDEKEAEPRLQAWWEENQTYKFNEKTKKPIFSIDTPPPTVSGKMHMGHAFMYSQMDFIARFKRMTGHELFYPFGTDDNGLPTQLLIQKTKRVRAKDLGRTEFTKLCLETLDKELRPKYIQDWKRIAMSCDWDIFYSTIDKHSRKISQWSFIELQKEGHAYRAHAPAMTCPRCRTSIAQVELVDLARTSTLYHVQVDVDGEKVVFATTRPELMMACIAITVHPDDKRYKHLVGKTATIPATDLKVPILADDMTKMEFGSGVVYWCPYGDANDIEFVAKHPELNVRHIMNADGRLNELAGKYEGMNSKDAREAVLKDWEETGAIVKQEPTDQVVNAHERCGTPIEFVAMNQWFIKMKDNKKKWLELGKKLKWSPDHMRNRYENWAKGLKWDWNISRQIFFGVPFPVWYCEKCEEPIMAKEKDLPVDPLVDKPPVKTCPKCKHDKLIPESDIINTWATSSLTPQLAINLVKDKELRKKLYPMSLRPQGHDIISFWLFNTVVKAQLHFNSLPWHNAMITGWALDPKGRKMSKSKGNVIEPQVMVEKYSADALRFWAASSKLGEDLPFKEKELVAGKKFVTKLWNASKFAWMHLSDFDGKKPKKLELLDQWQLSRLNAVIAESTKHFETFDYSKTKLEVENFFWHTFCDNYLEFVKNRLYNPDKYGKDARKSAQYSLYHSLLAILKLMAPITPHITEELYQIYYKDKEKIKSIHLQSWPELVGKTNHDAREAGDVFADVVAAVRKFKSQQKLSLKAEIANLTISGEDHFKTLLEPLIEDLKAVTSSHTVTFGEKGEHSTEQFPLKIIVDLA